jgi:ferredoxin-NADP reductase
MAEHIVKVLLTEFVTYNVKRFIVGKPPGYTFISGQATDVSINTPVLKNELRPFTFTTVNESDYLEFIIKIYKGHNGITEKLGEINAGDELILHDVFGTIRYQGEGLFIAGGAGITPFISIFRELKKENKLTGNTLLFANRTPADIILGDELKEMLGPNCINILEQPGSPDQKAGYIDKKMLEQYAGKKTKHYYICGPDKFTAIMIENLQELGVDKSKIVFEQ